MRGFRIFFLFGGLDLPFGFSAKSNRDEMTDTRGERTDGRNVEFALFQERYNNIRRI